MILSPGFFHLRTAEKVYTMEKLLNTLERVILFISGILMIVMIATITWQVILRYGFKSANAWCEELARYSLLCIVMLTAPIGLRRGRHVRVNFFVEMLPKKAQAVLDIIMDILMMAYTVGLFIGSITLMSNPSKQYSPGLHLDQMYLYAMIAFGCILLAIFMLDTVYRKYIMPRVKKDNREGDV